METKEKIRRSYMKPRVTQVKLEIQEAVLATCKRTTSDMTGKSNKGCTQASCKTTVGS